MDPPQQWRFGARSTKEAVGQVRAHHLVSQTPVGHSCEVAVMIHGRFVKKRPLLVCVHGQHFMPSGRVRGCPARPHDMHVIDQTCTHDDFMHVDDL